MEEFNFASERVQELIARLQGVTFFCAVALAAVNGNPESTENADHQTTTEKDQNSGQANVAS